MVVFLVHFYYEEHFESGPFIYFWAHFDLTAHGLDYSFGYV